MCRIQRCVTVQSGVQDTALCNGTNQCLGYSAVKRDSVVCRIQHCVTGELVMMVLPVVDKLRLSM